EARRQQRVSAWSQPGHALEVNLIAHSKWHGTVEGFVVRGLPARRHGSSIRRNDGERAGVLQDVSRSAGASRELPRRYVAAIGNVDGRAFADGRIGGVDAHGFVRQRV